MLVQNGSGVALQCLSAVHDDRGSAMHNAQICLSDVNPAYKPVLDSPKSGRFLVPRFRTLLHTHPTHRSEVLTIDIA